MDKWTSQIDETTHNFDQLFGGLSNEQLNWKPDPNSWSIAQNIDHLIVINQSYFPIIESIRKGTYKPSFVSKFGFIVSTIGNSLLKSVQPDRKYKMKTFAIWAPANSEIPGGIIERFKEHQTELKKLITDSQDLVESGVVISSPSNKNIVYTLERAFDIIVTHEKRHFEQAKEVHRLLQKN